MTLYRFRAKHGPDKVVEGRTEASSREEAIDKINQMGYIPVNVEEETEGSSKGRPLFSGRVKSSHVSTFSRQLASFMKSGMPILRALTIISDQAENPKLKGMFDGIRAEMRDGKTLSSALANYPRVFPALYIAMVRTGEDSGTLSEVFVRIADHRQKQEAIISQVRMAMVYPMLMACVGIATIGFMFAFVMPRLMRIFTTIGGDLPLVTKILISISNGLRSYWPWIALGIALLFFVVRQNVRTKAGRAFFSRLKLSMPIFGNFTRRAELARFTRTLELLIKNSIPILKAIETSIPTLDNEVIREELWRSCKELEHGGSFGKSLKRSKLFPSFMTSLLIVGEESGRLDEALSEIADSYERETNETIKVMTTLLEPVMILIMGAVVGFIVIAMLLPVFQINLMVQ